MSEIIAEAIAEKRVPQKLLDVFTPLVSECKMHFNDDGIHVRAVEPANVAMGYVDLDRAAFASYESPGAVTQGVNLDAMDDRLSVGDSGDLAQLSLDMESRKLNVDVGNVHQAMALIDPDAVRQEPDLPDLDLPNEIVLTGKQLKGAVDAVGMVSDHVEIRGDPEREVVEFVGEGDVDETVVDLGQDDVLDGTKITEAGASLFSHDYSEKLAKPIPNDAEVSITFGEEFPAVWDWGAVDGHMDVTQMIAPRIRSS